MSEHTADTHVGEQIYVDLTPYALDLEDEAKLVAEQDELTFTWLTKDGSPMSAIMSYVRGDDGRLWMLALSERKRVKAILRDNRVAATISGVGTLFGWGCTVSWKGLATVHDDRETVRWLLPQMGRRIGLAEGEELDSWVRVEDSPTRVAIAMETTVRVSFDIRKRKARTNEVLDAETQATQER
ncbi:hypothetical protein [Amycolatopsis sp.]|jgi:hypothetical protein|uniref:pyridoxamine 5'-phosphate oxidase family protein n=1 Tax=Amycolatopsis sp. TaxID=37632 RepID=UPI002E0D07BE|nr:hypothetical protein [Amycolatopsis sp.]